LFTAEGPSSDEFLEWIHIWDALNVVYSEDGSFVTVSLIDHVHLKVNLIGGNHSSILHEQIIFKSKVFKEIQKQLESKTKDQCLVLQGLPGIGKSTACWTLCCMRSHADASAEFIFVFFLQDTVRGVIHLQGGQVVAAAYVRAGHNPAIGDIIMELRQIFPTAQLVLDGVNQNAETGLAVNSFGWITVASVGLSFKGDSFNKGDGSLAKLELDSWTLEEFEKAVEKVQLDDQVLDFDKDFFGIDADRTAREYKQIWVKERYFISGGSARLMFSCNGEQISADIDEALANVRNLNDFFSNFIGHKSQGDVSRLRQRVDQKYTFLSPYVVRALTITMENKATTLDWDTFVKSAKEVAKNMRNNSFKGWVHEFDFLVKLFPVGGLPCKKLSLNLIDEAKKSLKVELEVQRVVRFWKEDDLADLSLKDQNVLALPNSFKQGTYDAAFVCFLHDKRPVIITLQATVSTTHSFQPSHITKLVNQIADLSAAKKGIFSLWHIFVLENMAQFNSFDFPECTEVGIRSTGQNEDKAWTMKPVFWKTNLNDA
jgi:hypothetical protein